MNPLSHPMINIIEGRKRRVTIQGYVFDKEVRGVITVQSGRS